MPINPSFTCPEQRDAGAMRIITFRKDGVWRTRYDHRPSMSAPHQMASLEGASAHIAPALTLVEKAFLHLGDFARHPSFSVPALEETGYLAEASALAATNRPAGDAAQLLAVVEFSPQWWATWLMHRGDRFVEPGALASGLIGEAVDLDDAY